MKDFVDKGIKASKNIAKQTGDKAQEWGEKGVLKLEVLQLRNQAEKLTARLGAEVYEVLVEKAQKTVGRESPSVKQTIEQIQALELQIKEKEEAFGKAGGKEEDLSTP
ncbi:MAG: hypothetical protein CVV51_04945 [Spirochaetae bacterium HGW-Spirochaetae-7]|nr:MAG: hypothetical protein CVV51_04945 [Spirochaetae bacterium HGW-Spirochaetae-7]